MSDWYYSTGGQAFGPVSEDTLRNKLSNSELSREDLVWNVGAKDWERVANIPSLIAAINTPPPLPLPPPKLPPLLPETAKVPVNYAWRRLIAKIIDFQVAGLIAGIPLALIAPQSQAGIFSVAWILTLTLWGAMDGALGCKTLGRAVLGIRVDKIREDTSYGDRPIRLAFAGMWLGLPIVSLIPLFIAYRNYRKTGTTFWDKGEFRLTFTPNVATRCVAGLGIILALWIVLPVSLRILALALNG